MVQCTMYFVYSNTEHIARQQEIAELNRRDLMNLLNSRPLLHTGLSKCPEARYKNAYAHVQYVVNIRYHIGNFSSFSSFCHCLCLLATSAF
jgi:hypothetical protein